MHVCSNTNLPQDKRAITLLKSWPYIHSKSDPQKWERYVVPKRRWDTNLRCVTSQKTTDSIYLQLARFDTVFWKLQRTHFKKSHYISVAWYCQCYAIHVTEPEVRLHALQTRRQSRRKCQNAKAVPSFLPTLVNLRKSEYSRPYTRMTYGLVHDELSWLSQESAVFWFT